MQTYQRPELSAEHQRQASNLAFKLVGSKRNKADLISPLAALLCENMRLALEVNEHRAARGFEPLPTVEQG